MNATKLIVSAVMACAVGVIAGTGCGASGGGGVAPTDAGQEAALPDATAQTCNPLQNQLCAAGQTCCFSGIFGTCTEVEACARPFQIACTGKASCGGSECCGSFVLPAGRDPTMFDASTFDASAFGASGFALSLSCAASCESGQFQLCGDNDPCPSGSLCVEGAFAQFPTCVPVRDGGGGVEAGAEAGQPDAEITDAAGEAGD